MKYIKSAANALILLMLFQCPLMAETVLLEDDFDHYPSGDTPWKGRWLDGMSGSGSAWSGSGKQAFWTPEGSPLAPGDASSTNPRRIVAAPGNRPGMAFCYSELSDNDVKRTIGMPGGFPLYHYPVIDARWDPLSDPEQIWEVSIDFYAEKINAPAKEGGFGVADIRSEPYDYADGKMGWQLITQVYLADNEGSPVIVFVIPEEPGGKPTRITNDIELSKWYKLRIQGDNKLKTLTFFIDDVKLASGHYVSNRASVESISIGDVNAGSTTFVEPGSIVFLDNVKVKTLARP